MYLTRQVLRISSDCASTSLPRKRKGRTLVGGQFMDPAEAHGVDMDSKHDDFIFESHNLGNLYANSEKPPGIKKKKKKIYIYIYIKI